MTTKEQVLRSAQDGRALQLAEKGSDFGEIREKHTSGLKAALILLLLCRG
jgi:hypothetical protein